MRSAFCRLIGTHHGRVLVGERLLQPCQRSVVAVALRRPGRRRRRSPRGRSERGRRGEHASGADPRLVVVRHHRLADDRRTGPGGRGRRSAATDLVADLHARRRASRACPGRSRRHGSAPGPTVITGRTDSMPSIGTNACTQSSPWSAHHAHAGDARRGHHVGMGGDRLPETRRWLVALVDDADDGIERRRRSGSGSTSPRRSSSLPEARRRAPPRPRRSRRSPTGSARRRPGARRAGRASPRRRPRAGQAR